jgi:sugar lactone lactonase YvrE
VPRVDCVHDARALLGEGAVWDPLAQVLYWVDIDGGRVHRFDPAAGPSEPIRLKGRVGCLVPRANGGALIGTDDGIHALDLTTGATRPVADPERDRPGNRFNDAATDRQGRWWVGSMGMAEPRQPVGAFYRLDPDLSLTRWLDGVYTPNGLAFSPDGRTMYLSDSYAGVRTIWACDYDAQTGTPTGRRVFFDTRAVAGRPDGATVDADGCYWMAGVGGWQLVRLTPKGAVDMIVDMPVARPTRPMFGGPGLATLFVTSIGNGAGADEPLAGGLFAVTGLPASGLPETRFPG